MEQQKFPLILAIDTSCDETSAAVTCKNKILANVIWSQASLHAKFGGVMPSLAQRMHQERIDFVINEAIKKSGVKKEQIEAVAVTAGPGLAIALEVGIKKAKELSQQWNIPIVAVNHIEGHLLSPLAKTRGAENGKIEWPAVGLVISGGHTDLVASKKIGDYQIIARTEDDAVGEALDKAARMLGLGYPGGAFLEKMAQEGNANRYPLPLPMAGRENRGAFSYSGLKTAMWRLVEKVKQEEGLGKQQIADLAAAFQQMAFKHLVRVLNNSLEQLALRPKTLLVGGGVSANLTIRRELRILGKKRGFKVCFPPSKKLCGDNAAMIGIAAGYKFQRVKSVGKEGLANIDRKPRWRVDQTTREYNQGYSERAGQSPASFPKNVTPR